MKKYLSLLIILNFNVLSVSGQNIIHNASFEDKDANEADWTPSTHSCVDKMQVWTDDLFVAYDINLNPMYYEHSPDWYKNGDGHFWLGEMKFFNSFNTNVPFLAHTGDGYVGMGQGELIEQQFFNSDPIKKGTDYTMSMFINTFCKDAVTSGGDYFNERTWPPDGIVHLKVFLSTQKIKYSTNYINGDNWITCADGDDTFDDHYQITNHIKEIKDIQLDITNYPYGSWHKITFTFNSPTDHNYEWIAIEEASSTDCKNVHYIGLDDISLIQSCALGCYATSGIPSPVVSTSNNAPLRIDHIQNVRSAVLKIFPISGADPIYKYSVTSNSGITHPIYWGGYVEFGGPAANALYTYSLVLENDCGKFTFGGNFAKVAEGDASAQNSQYPYTPKILIPCCIFNMNFSNQTINNIFLYSVINDITAGNNTIINSNSNITFQAGNSITLNPGFVTNDGAHFVAEIKKCN